MRRLLALLAAVALLVGAGASPALAAGGRITGAALAIGRPLATNGNSSPVTVTLTAMSPRTPNPANYTQPVAFAASIINNTDNSYSDVQLSLQRGLPITQQNLLDNAIGNPPATDFLVAHPLDLHQQLLPHARLVATYRTTVLDMCLCYDGVYPYALVASTTSDTDTGFTEAGRAQVFVPSFLTPPQPVSVGWIWPLLDKPHRSVDNDVFTDEGLAGEIGRGGRLDRALQVAELVAGKVRMTLVVDPDLLDSLAVMAKGYRVRKGTGTVPGTGAELAADWLARFKAVTTAHDVALTSYADPDVNALTRAGMSFATTLDPQVRARIAPYLNGLPTTDQLAWPAGGALTSKALDALVGSGAGTVLLSDAALPGGNHAEPRPDALAPLPTASGSATALVTDSGLQATVQRALKLGAAPADDQQTLLAQVAVRAAQDPSSKHFVVITPDRYVDTDPVAAARTIETVLGTGWSAPISIPAALSTVLPVDRGALNTAAERPSSEISQQQLSELALVQQRVSSMNEALHDNDASALLLAGFATGIQRGESSAWRTDRTGGNRVTDQLLNRIDNISGSVHLVQPADGTYSLSSTQSPIVVTVANQLSKPVTVRVVVTPVNSAVGFSAPAYLTQTIPARGVETVRIPTHVERLGKFQVVATLQTPDGRQLGTGIELDLRATAIGTVTKVITLVAIGVLVLALLRRLIRRNPARATRSPPPPAGPDRAADRRHGGCACVSDDWSEPQLYGSPMPVPGDATALAIRTAQPETADGWSTPIYHGPRRFRPRPEQPVRVNRDASGAQLVVGEQLIAEAPAAAEAPISEIIPLPAADPVDAPPADPVQAPSADSIQAPDVDSVLAPDVDRIQAPTAAPAARPAEAPAEAPESESLMASSRTMAVASLVSRVTGFLRSLVLVGALGIGVGEVADAYNLANTLPNMVYELLLGGVLTSVIIPVLVYAQHSDADRGVAYTQRLLSIATASLGGATVLAVLAAPALASIFGGSASKQSLTALWATLLLPEIFFYGLGAMFTAVLNTRGVYGWPAWAPALNNIITILSVGLFLLLPSASPLTSTTISNSQILVLGVGTTLGIAGQALILWWPLRQTGFSWHWRFRAYPTEAGRMAEFTNLTLWVLGYVAISQVGVFVVNRVANIRAGGPTTFANADLLFQVPYGILGVSLLTALMPRMSRSAARGDQARVLSDLRLGTRMSAVALVPVSAGLIVLGPSLTSVIFLGHARLSEARLVGIALAAGAFGLLPFALVMLQQRVFYAMRDARTPTFINLSMVGTKVVLVLTAYATLHGRAVIVALTVSTSTSYLAGCLAGHLLLRRRFGALGFASVLRTIGWILLAAAAGAAAALLVLLGIHGLLGSGRLASLLVLLGGAGLGGMVLGLVAVRLPLPEVAEILAAVRRRPARAK